MTAPLRERPDAAVHASPAAGRLLAGLRSTAIPAIVVGAFLAVVGAFGSSAMPPLQRFSLMIGMSFVGSGMGFAAFQVALRAPWAKGSWLRLGVTATLLMFAPMAMAVWGGVNLALPAGDGPEIRSIPGYVATSLVVTSFFCLAVAWMRRDAGRMAPVAVQPAPVKFLERLPLKLRGADVWAVEAEDHYLRLHTSKGQDLILMRLADAVAELDGIEGSQVHRSWWVARDAIVDAKRGDGRATLTLKDGAEVPVSRTYAGELREKGWI